MSKILKYLRTTPIITFVKSMSLIIILTGLAINYFYELDDNNKD